MPRSPVRHVAVLLLLGLGATALAGCGNSSVVGRRMDNFSAYYNKFYNAEQAFAEAVDPLDELNQPVNPDAYLPVFVEPSRANNDEALARTIEKSADLLRRHPESKWVDDALLLIGKSYLYRQNYVGAEQKFREVAERGGPLTGEAQFWMGRALLSSGRLPEAEVHLSQLLGTDTLSGEWEAKMYLLRGDVRIRQGAWAEGARALAEGVYGVRDNQTRARAFFLQGQALEAAGRPGEAAVAYQNAVEERPRYELAYAAEASALRTAAGTGRGEEILRRLRRMERDDKNEDKLAELSLLRGQLYQARGQVGAARRYYRDLLYPGNDRATGQAPLSGAVRGRTHYALGVLYRDVYDDFSRAAAHFDTAATALPDATPSADGTVASRPTAYAIVDSRRQAERYGRVAEAAAEVTRLDSLLRLGQLAPSRFEAFVDSLRRVRAETAREVAEQQQRQRAERRFQGGGAGGQRTDGFGGQQGGPVAGRAGRGGEAGFLFHRKPSRVQEGVRDFQIQWGNRPRVPNWRRQATISGRTADQAPGDPTEEIRQDDMLVESNLPDVDVSAVPRSARQQREMRTERAAARYDLGNALLLAASRPDSAAFWFRRVTEEESDTDVVRRAYYALAEAERAAGRLEEARAAYRRVVRDQPGTPLARSAHQRLDEEEGRASEASPEAAQAETAYTVAYETWQAGRREEALQQMLDAAAAYPDAAPAPRALLASAQIFAEWARRNDHPLSAPLPARLPDGLRNLLPESEAADSSSRVSGPASPVATEVPTRADSIPPVLYAAEDSLSTGQVRGLAEADSTRLAFPKDTSGTAAASLTLTQLLSGLVERYPQAPQGGQARRMLAALRESTASEDAPADGAVVPDSARADSAAPDSLLAAPTPAGQEDRDQRLRVVARGSDQAPPPSVLPGRPEDGAPPDEWTLVVASVRRRAQADSMAARLREQHEAVRVLPPASRSDPEYRVVVGRFASREEGEAARRRVPGRLADSQLLKVPSSP